MAAAPIGHASTRTLAQRLGITRIRAYRFLIMMFLFLTLVIAGMLTCAR